MIEFAKETPETLADRGLRFRVMLYNWLSENYKGCEPKIVFPSDTVTSASVFVNNRFLECCEHNGEIICSSSEDSMDMEFLAVNIMMNNHLLIKEEVYASCDECGAELFVPEHHFALCPCGNKVSVCSTCKNFDKTTFEIGNNNVSMGCFTCESGSFHSERLLYEKS